MNDILLMPEQQEAVNKLKSGSVLVGGVGSGKTFTSLSFFLKEYKDLPLIVITTAHKRDTMDWAMSCEKLGIENYMIDSWNNIAKYEGKSNCFFIFDEQRTTSYGKWAREFIKIAKRNKWILLTATPGDSWIELVSIFIANGYYKNKTEFILRHVIVDPYSKYFKIKEYKDERTLRKIKERIFVYMSYTSDSIRVLYRRYFTYDERTYKRIVKERRNPWEGDVPYKNISALNQGLRKCSICNEERCEELYKIFTEHKRIIVFYNYNYERDLIKRYFSDKNVVVKELNGERHDGIPEDGTLIYIVQYSSGAEGWETFSIDTMVFFSLTYSYKQFIQAQGRIDRRITGNKYLYYYIFTSLSPIDRSVEHCLNNKRDFNDREFISS